jgi:hypothetical protein
MGPKTEAAARFVERTGGLAAIGALDAAYEIVHGRLGTLVRPDRRLRALRRVGPDGPMIWCERLGRRNGCLRGFTAIEERRGVDVDFAAQLHDGGFADGVFRVVRRGSGVVFGHGPRQQGRAGRG